eukprot:scaffold3399_cov101-Isochrysis_galbana.AAC.1
MPRSCRRGVACAWELHSKAGGLRKRERTGWRRAEDLAAGGKWTVRAGEGAEEWEVAVEGRGQRSSTDPHSAAASSARTAMSALPRQFSPVEMPPAAWMPKKGFKSMHASILSPVSSRRARRPELAAASHVYCARTARITAALRSAMGGGSRRVSRSTGGKGE